MLDLSKQELIKEINALGKNLPPRSGDFYEKKYAIGIACYFAIKEYKLDNMPVSV